MKNNKLLYAKALAEILVKKGIKENEVIKNFVALLINNGCENASDEILQMTQDLLLEKQGHRKITFETARKATLSQQKMMQKIVKKGDKVTEKINSNLLAGIKIIINDSISFDASMQSKLQKI